MFHGEVVEKENHNLLCIYKRKEKIVNNEKEYSRLIIPRLNIHRNNRLGSRLNLAGLLLVVLLQSLLLQLLRGLIYLGVRTEQIDIIVVVFSGSADGGTLAGFHLGGGRAILGEDLGGITLEGTPLLLVGGDVLVPAGGVRVLGDIGSAAQGLVASNIGLRWGIALSKGIADVSEKSNPFFPRNG